MWQIAAISSWSASHEHSELYSKWGKYGILLLGAWAILGIGHEKRPTSSLFAFNNANISSMLSQISKPHSTCDFFLRPHSLRGRAHLFLAHCSMSQIITLRAVKTVLSSFNSLKAASKQLFWECGTRPLATCAPQLPPPATPPTARTSAWLPQHVLSRREGVHQHILFSLLV